MQKVVPLNTREEGENYGPEETDHTASDWNSTRCQVN